jgi:hypothetical protein
MSYSFPDLDVEVRAYMLEEFDHDVSQAKNHARYPYLSKLFTGYGREQCLEKMREALAEGDEASFCAAMSDPECWEKMIKGGVERFCHTEFNRYYMRGVILKAQRMGLNEVLVYRAKPVADPRWEGPRPGDLVQCDKALKDLRNKAYSGGLTGILKGANSGISVTLQQATRV